MALEGWFSDKTLFFFFLFSCDQGVIERVVVLKRMGMGGGQGVYTRSTIIVNVHVTIEF